MSIARKDAVVSILLLAVSVMGCRFLQQSRSETRPAANTAVPQANASPDADDAGAADGADDIVPSETGVEKEKPAAGKGNVQGKVLYNGQPAAGIEVKLCQTFNRYFGGCSGDTYTAQTDANGEYLIKNAPPGIYEGLVAKVFKTNYYVFATSGFVGTAKYRIDADKTYFAPETNLFKNDLKLSNPKAGSKVAPRGIEVKWEAYPDASYYKLSVHGDSSTGAETNLDYVNKRVDGLSFVLDQPLSPGSYSITVDAYNTDDVKLSQSPSDVKFTVTGGAK